MARISATRQSPQTESRSSGIWLAAGLVIAVVFYLLVEMESNRVHRQIAKTNEFSDALVSLQKVDTILILDTLAPANAAPFSWVSYRAGLLVQGKTVLSTMKADRFLLSPKQQDRLSETERLFEHLQRSLVSSENSLPDLVETDNRLRIRCTELSGWINDRRIVFLGRLRLLNLGKSVLILLGFSGSGAFLIQKLKLFRRTSRQNRFYQALSRIDRLILDLPEIESLLTETCRIVVEEGGVWLARFIRFDAASGNGLLLAHFGNATEEFNRFGTSSDPSVPEGRALWGETVRSKAPVVWNDLQNRVEDGPVRELYRRTGILSGAGFPVFRGGAFFGGFFVHSDESDFFDPDLVKLIGVLVENISFAIDNRDREDDRKAREAEITHLSLFDSLTDLPNRRLFQDRVHQATERHLRTQERFGVGILDLDGFKQVNDRLGHQSGDALLVEVAKRLQGALRGMDTLARLGGDEFGIIFAGLEKETGAALFERIIGSLALPFELGEEQVTIGGSLGITIVPPDNGDDESLLKHADIAMYQVKEHGKNGWELFRPAMTEALEKSHRIKEDLAKALQEDRLVLHYQPQVEMGSGRLVGVETLLRWNHPERGLLDSKHFIEVLEGCELIVDVERWVLDRVLSQIAEWTEKAICPKVRMNIGARHLLSGSFVEDLRNAFSRYPGVRPQSLELDITETKSFRDIKKVKSIFDACRRFGVSISIGNIGTEHGSLSYIQTLGVDRVTIDRRFVRNLPKSPQDMAIVASLVTSAQLLLIDVIGEGIETEEEGQLLLKWGCRIGQGLAIAPPMLPEKLPEWLEQYRPFDSWSQWNHAPWEPKDYPLLMAKEAARVFYESFLEGIEKPGETRVEWIDSHRCLQGRWIDRDGEIRYGNTTAFKEYRNAHERLHTLLREAVAARDTGDAPALDALKRSIKEVNRELICHLDRIQALDSV